MSTAIHFPAGSCDASSFVARHAGSGETPSTLGALPLTPYGEALIARIMKQAGRDFDGTAFVRVSPILWVTLDDLDVVEAALVLASPYEVAPPVTLYLETGLGLVDDSEPVASPERDTREPLELLTGAS